MLDAINEFLTPLYMLYNFYKCPVNQENGTELSGIHHQFSMDC